MDNNQQDITADLTDQQLSLCFMSAFNCAYDKPGACIQDGQRAGYRAVAALAREGWRPIPKDEGAAISLFERRSNPCPLVPSAEAEAQLQEPAPMMKKDSWSHGFDVKRLANRLDELAHYVTQGPECVSRNFVMQIPIEPCRDADMVLSIAAGLLRDWLATPKGAAPVLASERPWEREGWLDQEGRCWFGLPADGPCAAFWKLSRPSNLVRHLPWSLPHWAIPVPALGDAP